MIEYHNKITALYSSLSVGDEDRDGGESNSIVNQKAFLERYARDKKLINIRHYIDDDESGRFFDRSAYTQMISTIINLMSEEVSVDSFFLSGDLSFISDPLPRIDNGVFYAVFESLKMQRTLEFEYKSLGDKTYCVRLAQPYHVICQKGNWYMLAYCLKHKKCRIFAFSRMKNPKTTEERFDRPKDFNPKKYFDSEFGVWNTAGAPVKIELLFDEKINTYILERSWHPTQRLRHNKDGSVYLSFKTNQLPEALHWVMSFGSAVTVLNPQ